MKPLLLLFLVAVPLHAQPFYFDPVTGSPAGGGTIRLTINDLPIDLRNGTPEVFFGGVPSPTVTVIDAKHLTAVTPPHAEGVVTVLVRLNGAEYGTETDRSFGYVRPRDLLLVPVASDIPGGFGTHWTTDIWVFNDSDERVNVMPEVCFFIGAVFPCGNPIIVDAHAAAKIAPRGFPEMYLFPPTDIRDKLHFSIRARETSSGDPGTEIPIVPLSAYRDQRVVLINVPVSNRLRSVLRVYDQWRGNGVSMNVSVYDSATGALLLQRTSGLRIAPTDNPLRFPIAFFDLLSDPAVRGHDTVRIEIEEDNASLWAMLTLTDNATQHVTVLTSQ